MVKNKTESVRGKWGEMVIDYKLYKINSYHCKICGESDKHADVLHRHISEQHTTREKMEQLAEEYGYDDDSRIDRFRRVIDTLGNMDWPNLLTEASREEPISEVQGEEYVPGLNAP